MRRLVLLFLINGICTFSRASGTGNFWVYFGTFPTASCKGIYVSQLDAEGHLTQPQLAAENDRPVYLAVARRNRYLYAANETTNFHGLPGGSVSAFAINSKTGGLRPLNQISAVANGPDYISLDATGKMVMVANYSGSSVTSFPILADGSVGPAASFIQQHGHSVNPQRQDAPHAHSIVVDPGNHYALVGDLGLDEVLVFKIDPRRGTLTSNDPPFAAMTPGSGPRHLAFHPNGKVVYLISEMACTMTALKFDPKHGTLSELQTLSTLPPGTVPSTNHTAAQVIVHPSGKFLYGSNRAFGPTADDSLVVYQLDPKSGMMTFVQSIASGGKIPRSFNIDPSGKFLLCANQDSGNVVVFRIDPITGRLAPTDTRVNLDKPTCVVFVPET